MRSRYEGGPDRLRKDIIRLDAFVGRDHASPPRVVLLRVRRRLVKKQYEYEEELYLALDGSATVNVNASVPALVALRGVDLNVESARALRSRTRCARSSRGPARRVTALSSRVAYGRRFVHVSIDVADVRSLQRLAPFAWSTYRFDREGDVYEFKQAVGAPAGRRRRATSAGTASELVVVPDALAERDSVSQRAVAPDRARQHPANGNRHSPIGFAGTPIDIEVQMETQSILTRRCCCSERRSWRRFATFAVVIWWVARRGRAEAVQPATVSGRRFAGSRVRPTHLRTCEPRPAGAYRCSSSCSHFGVGLQIVGHREGAKRLAIDRASIRSVLLLTTPSSVTWPCSTMTWIGGLAIDP